MSITTKQGDEGNTILFSGESVSKASARTSAYGALDEVVSAIGMARALSKDERIRSELLSIQKVCFLIGTELATTVRELGRIPERLEKDHLGALENLGIELENQIELPPSFIIPGATVASAALDITRAIARRLERNVVSMVQFEKESLENPHILPYLNRLSDVLFLLARFEEKQQGVAFQSLMD